MRVYGATNLIVSVTKVKVSTDLLNVKLYVSVFPFSKSNSVLQLLSRDKNKIKNSLGSLMKDQLRRIPEPFFFLDDSLDHIEKVEKEIKSGVNPIPEFWKKRKEKNEVYKLYCKKDISFFKSKWNVVNVISAAATSVLVAASCSFLLFYQYFLVLKVLERAIL